MSAGRRLTAVPVEAVGTPVEGAPLTFFRHLEYANPVVHLPKPLKPIRFQGHFYTTRKPEEIAALRAHGGAIVEDSGEPEYRCTQPGCMFVTLKPAVLEGHLRTAHPGAA